MANRVIYPNYKPSWQYDSFDWSKLGSFVSNLAGSVSDAIWGVSGLRNGTAEAQATEQKRLELEAEKTRQNTILLVAAMAVGAICLILIFKK